MSRKNNEGKRGAILGSDRKRAKTRLDEANWRTRKQKRKKESEREREREREEGNA